MANIHVSWLDPHKVRKLTVVGSKKMLVFDDMQATEKIWIYDKGVGAPEGALGYGEDLSLRFGDITGPLRADGRAARARGPALPRLLSQRRDAAQ